MKTTKLVVNEQNIEGLRTHLLQHLQAIGDLDEMDDRSEEVPEWIEGDYPLLLIACFIIEQDLLHAAPDLILKDFPDFPKCPESEKAGAFKEHVQYRTDEIIEHISPVQFFYAYHQDPPMANIIPEEIKFLFDEALQGYLITKGAWDKRKLRLAKEVYLNARSVNAILLYRYAVSVIAMLSLDALYSLSEDDLRFMNEGFTGSFRHYSKNLTPEEIKVALKKTDNDEGDLEALLRERFETKENDETSLLKYFK